MDFLDILVTCVKGAAWVAAVVATIGLIGVVIVLASETRHAWRVDRESRKRLKKK